MTNKIIKTAPYLGNTFSVHMQELQMDMLKHLKKNFKLRINKNKTF